jgi:hypothetical protein
MPCEKGGQIKGWKTRDCRLSLRESSVSCEFGYRRDKARIQAPFAPECCISRKQRSFRGAKGDNGISLTIDEHQNSIRGGTKQAKKISGFRHLSGDANVKCYWLYVYVSQIFWAFGRGCAGSAKQSIWKRLSAQDGEYGEDRSSFLSASSPQLSLYVETKSNKGKVLRAVDCRSGAIEFSLA